MRELSLFSGAGGGLLGTTHLLGWSCVGYVEWEPYCQAVIAARIKDGLLEEAPIFGDIREFVKSGAAREYRGFADVVTAGFPCQPFSVAGKQLAAEDPRNMWPATADVIREVQPQYALFENNPGLLGTGYCERIFGDLAALGYDAEWGVFSAASEGADHLRERVWILAHGLGLQERVHVAGASGQANDRDGLEGRQANGILAPLADSDSAGGQQPLGGASGRIGGQWESISRNGNWALTSQPVLARGEDGVAHRLDRLRAIGNGQVSIVAARAWQELSL